MMSNSMIPPQPGCEHKFAFVPNAAYTATHTPKTSRLKATHKLSREYKIYLGLDAKATSIIDDSLADPGDVTDGSLRFVT